MPKTKMPGFFSMLVFWPFVYLYYQRRVYPCFVISKFLGFLNVAYTCFIKLFLDGLVNFYEIQMLCFYID